MGVVVKLLTCLLIAVSFPGCAGSSHLEEQPGRITEKELALNNILGNNMVIQRGCPFTIWGEGTTGERITASVSWNNTEYSTEVDEDGFWEIKTDVPESYGNSPVSFSVSNGKKQIHRVNMLIGEVWFLSGQSNMEMTMYPSPYGFHKGVLDYQSEVDLADIPRLRFYNCPYTPADTPQWNSEGLWSICSPVTAPALSVVGYYFARKLIAELDCPVGLVITAAGAQSAQIYTSEKTLATDPMLKPVYLDPYLADPSSVGDAYRPAKLYNGMIHPFFPLSVSGILWYQGESNDRETDTYDLLETRKLADWRENFGRSELPYYYVQIASAYMWGADPETNPVAYYDDKSAYFRETQAKVRKQNRACEMVTTLDVGDPMDVHPRNKKPIGERLSNMALNLTYGKRQFEYLAPVYESHRVENGVVKVKFANTGTGLNTNDGLPPRYFMVAGPDKRFHHAQAEIHSDQVWLTCPDVEDIVAVRYAFLSAAVTNLCGETGLPAEQFRTDNWNSVNYKQML